VIDEVSEVPQKRSEEEKTSILEKFDTDVQQQESTFTQIAEDREALKEKMSLEITKAFSDLEEAREEYK